MGYIAVLVRILMLSWTWILMKKMGKKHSPIVVNFIILALGTLVLAPFAYNFGVVPVYVVKWAFVAGVIYSIGMFLYSWAYTNGELSSLSPLYNLNVFFIFVIAVLFLGEEFAISKLIGTFILFYGALVLQKSDGKFSFNKMAFCMILSALCMAFGRSIDRFIVKDFPFEVYGFYIELFAALTTFLILIFDGKFGVLKKALGNDPLRSFYVGVVNIISYLSVLVALSFLEVSIVEPLALFAPLITILLAKYVFGEKIKARMFGTLIMIAGLILILI
jgi:bacterial/archaeal transporter family protein